MFRVAAALLSVMLVATCGAASPAAALAPSTAGPSAPAAVPVPGRPDVSIGVTTTFQDSGLQDALVPDFEHRTGYRAKVTAQGTGAVLALAAKGDVDAILVHEPRQELAFMGTGSGARRDLVMYNDFILVGPPGDPAGTKGRTIEDAFRAIAAAKAPFVSRGDRSGTDVAEKAIWSRIGLAPGAPWYLESGTGQGQALVVASEKKAYLIADRGTFFGRKAVLALDVMVEPQPRLLNLYHVITIDPARFPRTNSAGGTAFARYLLSPEGQDLIGSFGRDRFGASLFLPAAGKDEGALR